MRLSFRTTQLLGYILVVVLMGGFSIFAGFSFISETVVQEALLRVQMDLNSAWAAYAEEDALLQMKVGMISQHEELRSVLAQRTGAGDIASELELLRAEHGLHFLTLLDKDGFVVEGGLQPASTGRRGRRDPVIDQAFSGQVTSGTVLMSQDELLREREDLAVKAHIPLVGTERARRTDRTEEDRGLVLEAAFPMLGPAREVRGVLYGGILLNGKNTLVDRIRNAVFGDKTYGGKPLGTVTIFLWDVRVATNVIKVDSTRAIGTRVSDEVYTKVLERGERFGDRAFVVNDWYLSAYDPIKDPNGQIIGIMYVGLLEEKYLDYRSSLAFEFLGILALSLLLSVGLAFYLSGTLRRPIWRLVEATRKLSAGQLNARVGKNEGSREVAELALSFDSMAESLESHSKRLDEATVALKEALAEADEKNRAYLEMLGFVTHELKSPLASIVFAIGSLRDRILGPLTDEQEAVLKASSASADYLNSTIANYLNLSRIEEGELKLKLGKVGLRDMIVDPAIQRLSELAADNRIRVSCDVPQDLNVTCDRDLLTSVLQNLLSNAIKYGREGGRIEIGTEAEVDDRFVRLYVFNEGPGFTDEEARGLFTKFTRFTADKYSTKAGTGLGLFVTREIVEKHGGEIRAESRPGEWARFTLTIPAGTD